MAQKHKYTAHFSITLDYDLDVWAEDEYQARNLAESRIYEHLPNISFNGWADGGATLWGMDEEIED